MFRRNKPLFQILGLVVVLVVLVRYFYLDHRNNAMKLKAANIRNHELIEERNKFSRDLDAMSQSKLDVEYEMKTLGVKFDKFKEDCKRAKEKLENDANLFHDKSMKHYKALETEHQMLKAEKDALETEHKHVKISFNRLKEDHSKTQKNHEDNVADLKLKHENIISNLEAQIEYYHKREKTLQSQIDSLVKKDAQKLQQATSKKSQVGKHHRKTKTLDDEEVLNDERERHKKLVNYNSEEEPAKESDNENLAQKINNVKDAEQVDHVVKRGVGSKIGDEDVENESRRKETGATEEDENGTVSEEQMKGLKNHDRPEIEQNDEIVQLKPKVQEPKNEENDFDNDMNNLNAQQLNNDQKFADNNEADEDVAADEDKNDALDPGKLLGGDHVEG